MREQILILEQLQKIDMELGELEDNRNEYPQKISAYEEELQTKKDLLAELNNQKEELAKDKSDLEEQIACNDDIVKKSEEKLFEIKTYKEYVALQREIVEAKKMNSELEEELLEKMDNIEKLEAKILEENTELSGKEEDYRLKIEDFKEKLEDINALYHPKKEEKERVASQISADILPLYEKIRRRNGTVLVYVENEICSGCNMNIPPQLFNEVLTLSRIIQCPNCQKILYSKDEPKS